MPDPGRNACSHTHSMGNHRGQLLQAACQPRPAPATTSQADGLIRLSGRTPQAGTPDQTSCRRGSSRAPCTQVRLAAFLPGPGRHGWSPRTERPATRTANPLRGNPALPCPRGRHDRLPGGLRQGRLRRRLRRPGSRPVLDPPARSQNPAAIGGQGETLAHPKSGQPRPEAPQTNACSHRPIQVRRQCPREMEVQGSALPAGESRNATLTP